MPLTIIFISSFVVTFSGALAPGPLLVITIDQSIKKGAIAGPLIVLGHAILEIVILVLLLYGIKNFLSSILMKLIFLSGAFILIFMAGNLFFRKSFEEERGKVLKKQNTVILGIIGSLSNPYWTIWWLTIGAGLLIQSKTQKFAGICAFFTGHILADFLWYWFVSFSVSKGRRFLNEKAYRIVSAVCSLFLLVLAGFFIVKFFK